MSNVIDTNYFTTFLQTIDIANSRRAVCEFFNSNQGTQFEVTVYNALKLLANDAPFIYLFLKES